MAADREVLIEFGGKRKLASLRDNQQNENALDILKETFCKLQNKDAHNGDPGFSIFNHKFHEYGKVDEMTKIPDESEFSVTLTYKLDIYVSINSSSPIEMQQAEADAGAVQQISDIQLKYGANPAIVLSCSPSKITDSPVSAIARKGLPYPQPLPQLSPTVQPACKNGHILDVQQHFIRDFYCY